MGTSSDLILKSTDLIFEEGQMDQGEAVGIRRRRCSTQRETCISPGEARQQERTGKEKREREIIDTKK